jgi:hypothetical protein
MNLSDWLIFSAETLYYRITEYKTFDDMLKNINKEEGALDLLRINFLGSMEPVRLSNPQEQELAGFLVGLGVLTIVEDGSNIYRMSSPYTDMIIRFRNLPEFDLLAPGDVPPQINSKLDIPFLLKTALAFFNKDIICLAPNRSFKTAEVTVRGSRNITVPRESVYENELNRVLMNWLTKFSYDVTCQWHTRQITKNDEVTHQYCDIVILSRNRSNQPVVVFELLATGTRSALEEHFTRTLEYRNNFTGFPAGVEIWVINFTCADDAISNPYWPSNVQQSCGLNVMHIWHDANFMEIKMCYNNGRETFDTLKLI